jgi:hypothetical protein
VGPSQIKEEIKSHARWQALESATRFSEMVKKRVPEWLNSSLWTSAPSPDDDDRLQRNSTRPTTTTTTIYSAPAVDPGPPPSFAGAEPPKPPETKGYPTNDSASNDRAHNGSSEDAGPSAEDISRQAQLLAEVSPFPSLSVKYIHVFVCINWFDLNNFVFVYGNVDIEESDKHAGLAENCVAGDTGWRWDSFHGVEGVYFVFDLSFALPFGFLFFIFLVLCLAAEKAREKWKCYIKWAQLVELARLVEWCSGFSLFLVIRMEN